MIFYRQYQPGPELSDLVECYWVYHSSGEPRRMESLIPGGRVEMIFHFDTSFHWLIRPDNLLNNPITRVHFMGQRDRVHFGCSAERSDMLGVRFRPGGLTALSDVSVAELLNKMIPAEEVMGLCVKEWEERLYEQEDDLSRIQLLEQLLGQKLAERRNHKWLRAAIPGAALAIIRDRPDEGSIEAICRQTGWYYKKLERVFKAAVGYTPKQYCSLIRFNKAIRQLSHDQTRSLTEIGYDCGYYDQSHFIKDFYRYAGVSPGKWDQGNGTIADLLIRYQPV